MEIVINTSQVQLQINPRVPAATAQIPERVVQNRIYPTKILWGWNRLGIFIGYCILNLIVVALGVGAAILLIYDQKIGFAILLCILIIFFLAYLMLAAQMPDFYRISRYDQMKSCKFQEHLNKMKTGRAYFQLYYSCHRYRRHPGYSYLISYFHEQRRRIYPQYVRDETGLFQDVTNVKLFVFVQYIINPQFQDQRSRQILQEYYDDFLQNVRQQDDRMQKYACELKVQDCSVNVLFNESGGGTQLLIMMVVFVLSGLHIFSLWILSIFTARYEIIINKRVRIVR